MVSDPASGDEVAEALLWFQSALRFAVVSDDFIDTTLDGIEFQSALRFAVVSDAALQRLAAGNPPGFNPL